MREEKRRHIFVHVVRLVVGHRPDNPEFVAQIVPEPSAATIMDNPAFESFGGMGRDVAGVDPEPLEHPLARLDDLLDGIEDDEFLVVAQMGDEIAVGSRWIPVWNPPRSIGTRSGSR
jgi:hypothetical protein